MAKPETVEQARKQEASGAGKASMDAIRAKVAEIDKVERDLMAQRAVLQTGALSTATTVASQVKSLATQTAQATDEIRAQIAGMRAAMETSAKSIQGIAEIINHVNQASTTIASAVEERAAQETGGAAGEVHSAANDLSKNGELLKQQVDNFLREIRAA